MKCQSIRKDFPAYLDNMLEPPSAQKVADHLRNCAACRRELEFYRKSWDLLGVWKEQEPAPGYIGRFWSRLAEEKTWAEQALENIRNILARRAFAPVLVAASVLIIAGSVSYRQYASAQKTEMVLAAMTPEEIELVDYLELARNLDVISNMDIVEDLEIVENLDALQS